MVNIWPAAGGTLSALALLAPLAAAADLDPLLGGMATPDGTVDVLAWLEQESDGQALVVSFVPIGGARLVADPGIVVTPRAGEGVAWASDEPVSVVDPALAYFDLPPEIRVPFKAGGEGAVEAHVEYAYCLVEHLCLFGDETVRLPLTD